MAVRWGVLSTARINDLVLAGARKSDRVDVVAVGGRDRARTEAYAHERGIERAHGSYEALIEDPEVEAVYISLPNSLHVEWSIHALEAGKHVLCEKPLSRHASDVETAFDTAERAGLLLSEAFMYRHHPQTAELRRLVADGVLGQVRMIRSAFSFDLLSKGDERNVRLQAGLDGGALMDVGCYCVSGTRLLAGEPVRVYAEQVVGPSDVDVRFAATMSFANDVVGQFDCALELPERDELEVIGAEASVFLDDPWHCRSPVLELRRDGSVEAIEVEAADPYQLELENLGDAIRGDAELRLGRDDAVGQARAIEALYRSAETGSAVSLT